MNTFPIHEKFALRSYSGHPRRFFLVERYNVVPTITEAPAAGHHIVIVDRSGSMYGDMEAVRSTLEKVFTLDEFRNPSLKCSLISYSSHGDVTLHFAKVLVADVMAPGSKYLDQIRRLQATAMTCISQSLKLADTLVDDSEATCISLHSDGYANDLSPSSEHREVASAVALLKKHKSLFVNTVAYRNSCDFPFLASIANQLSGTCVQATTIKQVYEALYNTTRGLLQGVAPSIQIPLWNAKYAVAVSMKDQKVIGSDDVLEVRGLSSETRAEDLVAYRYHEVDQKTWTDSTAQEAGFASLALLALIRYFLTSGRLNEAKYALMSTKMKGYILRNYRALVSKDVAEFISETGLFIFDGALEDEECGFGLPVATTTTVLQFLDFLKRHRDSVRVHFEALRAHYQRRGLKRIPGTRLEDGTIREPEFGVVRIAAFDTWMSPSSVDVNRNNATANITFAYPVDLIRRSTEETIKEVEGVPLRLYDYRAYTLVSDGQVNIDKLLIKVSSKKAWADLTKLGLVVGEFTIEEVCVNLKQMPVVGDEVGQMPRNGLVMEILLLTAFQKMLSALSKGTSVDYTEKQIEALRDHCISPNLYINFPTTVPYKDLQDALSKGEVDYRTSYSVMFGTHDITSPKKLKSGNEIFASRFTLTVDGQEVERPKLDMVWGPKAFITHTPPKSRKVNHGDLLMEAVLCGFFWGNPNKTYMALYDLIPADENRTLEDLKGLPEDVRVERLKSMSRLVDKLLDERYASLSPLVFYIGATGLVPDGMKAMDADALTKVFPDISLSKEEKEGTFFLLPDGSIVSVYATAELYSVESSGEPNPV